MNCNVNRFVVTVLH